MKKKFNWSRIIYFAGLVAMMIGIIDPLEGSVVICAGSVLVTLGAYLMRDPYRKIFLLSFILVAIGVAAMFFFSSLGGFGGTSKLSWWWGLFILPYPIGWLLVMIFVVVKAVKKQKSKRVDKQNFYI